MPLGELSKYIDTEIERLESGQARGTLETESFLHANGNGRNAYKPVGSAYGSTGAGSTAGGGLMGACGALAGACGNAGEGCAKLVKTKGFRYLLYILAFVLVLFILSRAFSPLPEDDYDLFPAMMREDDDASDDSGGTGRTPATNLAPGHDEGDYEDDYTDEVQHDEDEHPDETKTTPPPATNAGGGDRGEGQQGKGKGKGSGGSGSDGSQHEEGTGNSTPKPSSANSSKNHASGDDDGDAQTPPADAGDADDATSKPGDAGDEDTNENDGGGDNATSKSDGNGAPTEAASDDNDASSKGGGGESGTGSDSDEDAADTSGEIDDEGAGQKATETDAEAESADTPSMTDTGDEKKTEEAGDAPPSTSPSTPPSKNGAKKKKGAAAMPTPPPAQSQGDVPDLLPVVPGVVPLETYVKKLAVDSASTQKDTNVTIDGSFDINTDTLHLALSFEQEKDKTVNRDYCTSSIEWIDEEVSKHLQSISRRSADFHWLGLAFDDCDVFPGDHNATMLVAWFTPNETQSGVFMLAQNDDEEYETARCERGSPGGSVYPCLSDGQVTINFSANKVRAHFGVDIGQKRKLWMPEDDSCGEHWFYRSNTGHDVCGELELRVRE